MRKLLQTAGIAFLLVTLMPWSASAQRDPAPSRQAPAGREDVVPGAREATPPAAPTARSEQATPPHEEPPLVARVNGEGITEAEFENNVRSTIEAQRQAADPQTPPPDPRVVQQQVLDALIESRLVEQHLREQVSVEPKEIENVVAGFVQQLQAQQLTLDAFLAELGQTEQDLRKRIEGSLAWQKFQEQQLVPDNLQAYFQQNQQQFDGRSYEEVEPMLPQLYVQDLWNHIVAQMQPEAEIEVFQAQQPAPPSTPQAPPIAP